MGIEDKYPGLFRGLDPIAKASVGELFPTDNCGACYGREGNTGKRIVFCFDDKKIAVIDGFQVLPLAISSLGNRRLSEVEGKSVLGFTFDHREYTLVGLTQDDLDILEAAFLSIDKKVSRSVEEVTLSTIPFIHGYEVTEIHGLVFANASSVDSALDQLKNLAREAQANAVVGVTIGETVITNVGEQAEFRVLAYGTAISVFKSN